MSLSGDNLGKIIERYSDPFRHSLSSFDGPVEKKNEDDQPYIDLIRWGIVFFREKNPFHLKETVLANKPANFLEDAKTTKPELIYHKDYIYWFFYKLDKNEPEKSSLLKIKNDIPSPRIVERDTVDHFKIVRDVVPDNLNINEERYLRSVIDNLHSLPF